ncbi:hypothetical protein ABZ353_08950 [Streptomyces niveus]|uniref:hypothetical protein n=1 Tax=Streptomyces niveus TaxID=193462 RepID=UPI000D19B521|nr:hypothetical protein [Streptomyces niveus]
MRSHVSSRAAAAAVCAALVLGTAGTAVAVTSANETPAGVGAEAFRAPIADAAAIKQQAEALSSLSGAITPVTDLLADVLAADNGQLAAADIERHQAAIKKGLDAVKNAAPAAPAAPAKPADNDGNADAMNPVNAVGADGKAPAAADMTAQAVDSVQRSTDALLKAAATKDSKAVATQSQAVVTSLVNLTTALVMNGAMPAPNLPGLPELPKLPGAESPVPAPELPAPAPEVPAAPELPGVPTTPQNQ